MFSTAACVSKSEERFREISPAFFRAREEVIRVGAESALHGERRVLIAVNARRKIFKRRERT